MVYLSIFRCIPHRCGGGSVQPTCSDSLLCRLNRQLDTFLTTNFCWGGMLTTHRPSPPLFLPGPCGSVLEMCDCYLRTPNAATRSPSELISAELFASPTNCPMLSSVSWVLITQLLGKEITNQRRIVVRRSEQWLFFSVDAN